MLRTLDGTFDDSFMHLQDDWYKSLRYVTTLQNGKISLPPEFRDVHTGRSTPGQAQSQCVFGDSMLTSLITLTLALECFHGKGALWAGAIKRCG